MENIALILAVAIGYGVARVFQKREFVQLPIILAFSGAFLLSTTLFELLPEVFENGGEHIGVFIMAGILLQIVLDFFSKGAEHGHVHIHTEQKAFPLALFISLSVHALIEGFPITGHDTIFYGLIVHKIPIAIILALFFQKANFSNTTTLVFLTLFAIMTPLGSFLMAELPLLQSYAAQVNAIAIGIFLHVSTTILFESSKNHNFNLSKMTAVFLAVVLAYFL